MPAHMATRTEKFWVSVPVSVTFYDTEVAFGAQGIRDQLGYRNVEDAVAEELDSSFEDWTSTGGEKRPLVVVGKVRVTRRE